MLFVVEDPGQEIRENRQRFFKGNAMFLQICLGLFRVPLKLKKHSGQMLPRRSQLLSCSGSRLIAQRHRIHHANRTRLDAPTRTGVPAGVSRISAEFSGLRAAPEVVKSLTEPVRSSNGLSYRLWC